MTSLSSQTFWRLAWSKNWFSRHPWSLDQKPLPFIGKGTSVKGAVVVRTLGPVSLMSVRIP